MRRQNAHVLTFALKWPGEPIKALGVFYTYVQKLLLEKNFIENLDKSSIRDEGTSTTLIQCNQCSQASYAKNEPNADQCRQASYAKKRVQR